jgi:hypothetical protein
MAKTIINLSDPVSTLVSKTNTISDHIGDITQLNVPASADSDIVQAINYIHSISEKTDSSDIINLIDSAYVQARQTGATQSSIMSYFQKDSDNGIGLDSAEGRFFIPSHTVNTSMIETSAITTDKIAGSAITGSKIADDQINSQHYVDGSIDTSHIADNQITTTKIADLNVTTAKIAADAIDGTKIADDAINSEHYVDGSIDTSHIADNQITEAKIGDDAVGSAQLKTLSTLLIKNSSGTTLKTIHGAGA